MSGRVEVSRQSAAEQAVPLGGTSGSLAGGRGLAHRGTRPLHRAQARGSSTNVQRDALFRCLLLLADVIAVVGAFVLMEAVLARNPHITVAIAVAIAVLLACSKLLGLYDRDEALLRKTTLDEVPKLFSAATFCVLATWIVSGSFLDDGAPRAGALLLWIFLIGLLAMVRTVARSLALRLSPAERCLLIGEEEPVSAVRAKLVNHAGIKASMVAHLDPGKVSAWSTDEYSASRLGEIRDLASVLEVDRAIILSGSVDAEETLDLVRSLKAVGVRVSVVPRLLEVVGSSVEFDDLHGLTVLGVRPFDLSPVSVAVKRAFDLLAAGVGLLVMGPLMLVIAAAIKLDGRGPVLFRQQRVGQHGRHFWMIKFRTMVPDADALKDELRALNEAQDGLFKIADDPRVTRVGRFLRKSSLDELPQLLNVIRGEMSLVGPRPLVIEEDHKIEGWDRRRLDLMPGVTGPWQILGPTRVPLQQMGSMDYLYVANWSLWSDMKILLRTVAHVLERRGL